MKLLTLFIVPLLAFSQSVPTAAQAERAQPVILATQQQAQTVMIALSADVATIYESLRLSTPGKRDSKGVSAPEFSSISDLINFLITQQARQLAQRFPPPSVKAATDAATAASKAADDAVKKAVAAPEPAQKKP